MRTRRRRASQRAKLNRLTLLVVLLSLLLMGHTAFRLIKQRTEIGQLSDQIALLRIEQGNLKMCIEQYHDLPTIAYRAQEMGMCQAGDDDVRVVTGVLPRSEDRTLVSAQDAHQR